MFSPKRLLASASILLAIAVAGSAQPVRSDSDVYLTTANGLHFLETRTPYTTTTLVENKGPGKFEGVIPNRYNTGAAFLDSRFSTSYLLNYQPQTQTTSTVVALTGQGHARCLAFDQDGQYVIATTGRLLKTAGVTNNRFTTLVATFPGSGSISGLCIDDDTGDYVVTLLSPFASSGLVIRVDRNTLQRTTIASGLPFMNSIDHDQRTGHFMITRGVAPQIIQIDRSGTIVDQRTQAGVIGAIYDDTRAKIGIWEAESFDVRPLTRNGGLYLTRTNLGTFHGACWTKSRKLYREPGASAPKPGTLCRFVGRFPDSPRAGYVAGLSAAGLRPGLAITSELHVNVALDALFFNTAAGALPLFTSGFIGSLDNTGAFRGAFLIPQLPASLTTLTVAAAAVNPSKPGNLDIATSLTIRLAP